jgi:uncharacterized protein (TIGR02271 family)
VSQYLIVVDRDGERCVFSADDIDKPQVTLLLEGDRKVAIPREALVQRENGTHFFPYSIADFERGQPPPILPDSAWVGTDEAVIPVVAEAVKVDRRWVETGKVRINKVVHQEEQSVETSLLRDVVDVKRVPIDRMIDRPVPIRNEGETLIIPVVEEVLVVEKRYILKEEIHVTQRQEQVQTSQTVPLRREEVTVERVSTEDHD